MHNGIGTKGVLAFFLALAAIIIVVLHLEGCAPPIKYDKPSKMVTIEKDLQLKLVFEDYLMSTVENPDTLRILSWKNPAENLGPEWEQVKALDDIMICHYTYTYRNTVVTKKSLLGIKDNIVSKIDLVTVRFTILNGRRETT